MKKYFLITVSMFVLHVNAAALKPSKATLELFDAIGDGEASGPKLLQAIADGADVNFISAIVTETPLLRAVRAYDFFAVETLLDKGADSNTANISGVTPLKIASELPSHVGVGMVRLLLANRANPNCITNEGSTPLMSSFSYEIMEDLLKAGAKTNMRNNEGKTVFDFIRPGLFDVEMFDLFKLSDANYEALLKKLRLLIDFKANPFMPGKNGLSPVEAMTAIHAKCSAIGSLNEIALTGMNKEQVSNYLNLFRSSQILSILKKLG